MEHVSLDGVIEIAGEDGNFPYGDWTAPYRTPEGRDAVAAAHGDRFDLLLGRRTYDLWSSYWPQAPSSPIADGLNAATKYVVTHHPESLAWGPSAPLGSDFVDEVRGIKSRVGPDLILWGSSTLTSTLLREGLVDELHLIVYPVLLGTGKRLFADSTPACAFKLISTKTMPTGIFVNHYKFAQPMDSQAVHHKTN